MPNEFARCTIVPQAEYQVAFTVDGAERLRWHYGSQYPRPFFFPFIGPSREPLTRMGHPGAPDHDHHRSIWFAHEKVNGVNFWSDRTAARIQQKEWLVYHDSIAECAMAVKLGWFDGHDPKELMEQEFIAMLRPGIDGESFLELQSTFRPTAETLELGKTNFGFLAVRVAKSLSVFFGGGILTNSEGAIGESAIFGKPAKWVDYSGPISKLNTEGITYFDHPTNPRHPNGWHVREDGWMGCSPCMSDAIVIKRASPLVLRYQLHAHRGPVNSERANAVMLEFAQRKSLQIVRPKVKHTAWILERTV